MKKFKINVPYDYVSGHLRCGHGEAIIEAQVIQTAKELAHEFDAYDVVVDDYEVDECGELDFVNIEIEEISV